MSEHLPADQRGGDESAFLETSDDQTEHPLEGGQGDEVDKAQESRRTPEDAEE